MPGRFLDYLLPSIYCGDSWDCNLNNRFTWNVGEIDQTGVARNREYINVVGAEGVEEFTGGNTN